MGFTVRSSYESNVPRSGTVRLAFFTLKQGKTVCFRDGDKHIWGEGFDGKPINEIPEPVMPPQLPMEFQSLANSTKDLVQLGKLAIGSLGYKHFGVTCEILDRIMRISGKYDANISEAEELLKACDKMTELMEHWRKNDPGSLNKKHAERVEPLIQSFKNKLKDIIERKQTPVKAVALQIPSIPFVGNKNDETFFSFSEGIIMGEDALNKGRIDEAISNFKETKGLKMAVLNDLEPIGVARFRLTGRSTREAKSFGLDKEKLIAVLSSKGTFILTETGVSKYLYFSVKDIWFKIRFDQTTRCIISLGCGDPEKYLNIH